MKINIEKKGASVLVEFAKDSSSAPVVFTLDKKQIETLKSMLSTVTELTAFKFTYEF